MEILDLYDNQGNKLNKTVVRGEHFEKGNIALVVVFMKNSKNEYLIQKRSKEKGGLYASTGGHVISGENFIHAIRREVKEELGIDLKENEFKLLNLAKHPEKSCLISTYLVEKDINLSDLTLQKEEVETISYLTKEEIEELIKNKKVLLSHKYLYESLIK